MNQTERLVKIDDAQTGQVLSRPVGEPRGQALLPAGAVLTDTHIASLRRREVPVIWVLNGAAHQPRPAPDAAALRAHHHQRLARLFRNTEPSSGSAYLLALMRRYRDTELP